MVKDNIQRPKRTRGAGQIRNNREIPGDVPKTVIQNKSVVKETFENNVMSE